MDELADYRGDFKPDLKLQDFSKETLVRLFNAAAKLYLGIDGMWHTVVKEQFGREKALEMEKEVWERATVIEISRVMAAANIDGKDVSTVFKVLQCDPGAQGTWEMDFDLKDSTQGVLTVRRCRSLESFERAGDVESQKYVCEVIEKQGMEETVKPINPNMKVRALKLPPRRTDQDIACQWEFKIEE
ncbi:DUF6125 family protein [Chloroflexota bacterium]